MQICISALFMEEIETTESRYLHNNNQDTSDSAFSCTSCSFDGYIALKK